MKTITALILGLSSALALSTSAAEPFNDRGENFINTVPASSPTSREVVIAEPHGFNSRGVDYVAALPAGSDQARQPVTPSLQGFNSRSGL